MDLQDLSHLSLSLIFSEIDLFDLDRLMITCKRFKSVVYHIFENDTQKAESFYQHRKIGRSLT